jgi:hypothetical protein
MVPVGVAFEQTFLATRPALAATYTAWRKELTARSSGLPWPHNNYVSGYMALVGLSAEEKADWLTFQAASEIVVDDRVAENKIKVI